MFFFKGLIEGVKLESQKSTEPSRHSKEGKGILKGTNIHNLVKEQKRGTNN